MEVKLLEIRDAGTFIPVMAICMESTNEEQRWLLARAGYGAHSRIQKQYILVVKLVGDGTQVQYDPLKWSSSRTMTTAHKYILDSFGLLKDGDVIDVEYLLGEKNEIKISERYDGLNDK